MKPPLHKTPAKRPQSNQRRERVSFARVVGALPQRTQEHVNRRNDPQQKQLVLASPVMSDEESGLFIGFGRVIRWCIALALFPLCTVTTWTFLGRFSYVTFDKEFWRTAECCYFTTGCLVMAGWFFSGLGRTFFLYMYVLGHEVTHAVFVLLFRGRVIEFHVGSDGGFITTNKTNLLISLSPYFVPFWSVVVAGIYFLMGAFSEVPTEWRRVMYAMIGVTWTFHMFWTLWMIPRDQPDLKDNGTFLSLMIIYLSNVLVLVGLLCISSSSPWQTMRDFGMEWVKSLAMGAEFTYRWLHAVVQAFQAAEVY